MAEPMIQTDKRGETNRGICSRALSGMVRSASANLQMTVLLFSRTSRNRQLSPLCLPAVARTARTYPCAAFPCVCRAGVGNVSRKPADWAASFGSTICPVVDAEQSASSQPAPSRRSSARTRCRGTGHHEPAVPRPVPRGRHSAALRGERRRERGKKPRRSGASWRSMYAGLPGREPPRNKGSANPPHNERAADLFGRRIPIRHPAARLLQASKREGSLSP